MTKTSDFISIENEFIQATLSCYGAHLVSLIYKPLNRECVCGFDNIKDLKSQTFYLGACVGRVANRIKDGQFMLNENQIQLDINNGSNHLHGGKDGFNQKLFSCTKVNEDTLIAKLFDAEKTNSYPGDINFELSFQCVDASLLIKMKASTTKDTLFDPTLHTYFNLNENKRTSVLNHKIQLNADVFYGLDASGCTERNLINVTSLFNPREYTSISAILKQRNSQLERAKGIDHYYHKKDIRDPFFANCKVNDLSLRVETSHVGAHIYSGNYLESTSALSASFLQENGGVCFETHHIPNSINFERASAPILNKNKIYTSWTSYNFKGEENE